MPQKIEELARQCELNMISKLRERPPLEQWLMYYSPPSPKIGFAGSRDPRVAEISKLVESDGHSGTSFYGCLRSVQSQLRKQAFGG